MTLTRCLCKLRDCVYFNAVPGSTTECDCAHADKAHYMFNPCPLYRKEWAEASADKLNELKAKMRSKRSF